MASFLPRRTCRSSRCEHRRPVLVHATGPPVTELLVDAKTASTDLLVGALDHAGRTQSRASTRPSRRTPGAERWTDRAGPVDAPEHLEV